MIDRHQRSRFAYVGAFFLSVGSASGQSLAPVENTPPLATVDENNVDMTSGQTRINVPLLAYNVSPNAEPLSVSIVAPFMGSVGGAYFTAQLGSQLYDALSYIYSQRGNRVVMPGANGETFTGVPSTQSDGSKFVSPNFYRGAVAPMGFAPAGSAPLQYFSQAGARIVAGPLNQASQIIFPDGETWDLLYNSVTYAGGPVNPGYSFPSLPSRPAVRLKFLLSSRGYGVQLSYVRDSLSGTNSYNEREWSAPTKITFFNRASVYCDTTNLIDCSSLTSLNLFAQFTYNNTDNSIIIRRMGVALGTKFKFTLSNFKVDNLDVPNSSITYGYTGGVNGNVIGTYTNLLGTFNYFFSQDIQEGDPCPCAGTTTGGRDDPYGTSIATRSDINSTFPTTRINEKGVSTDYQWRRAKVVGFTQYDQVKTYPGVIFEEDSRGNVTKQRAVSSSDTGSAITPIYTATFPTECLNPKTCNKPTSVADANGNVTTYTYNPDNGGVLTATSPAVKVSAAGSPSSLVKRYSYVQRYAWIKSASGAFVHAGDLIWLLASEKTCRTTTTNIAADSCAGGSLDEVVINYEYGPDTGLVGNNLFLRGKVVTADGLSLRTCYGYDEVGNKIWETSPRAGLAVCS